MDYRSQQMARIASLLQKLGVANPASITDTPAKLDQNSLPVSGDVIIGGAATPGGGTVVPTVNIARRGISGVTGASSFTATFAAAPDAAAKMPLIDPTGFGSISRAEALATLSSSSFPITLTAAQLNAFWANRAAGKPFIIDGIRAQLTDGSAPTFQVILYSARADGQIDTRVLNNTDGNSVYQYAQNTVVFGQDSDGNGNPLGLVVDSSTSLVFVVPQNKALQVTLRITSEVDTYSMSRM